MHRAHLPIALCLTGPRSSGVSQKHAVALFHNVVHSGGKDAFASADCVVPMADKDTAEASHTTQWMMEKELATGYTSWAFTRPFI